MSTAAQLTTRSSGQEQLKEEWNTLKADKAKAQDALRQAKREIPQDPEKVNNAKADIAKANDALKAQREKEKEFNNAEKARILGANQTKQDTLDNPTNSDASQAENTAQTAESSTSGAGDTTQSSEGSTSSSGQSSSKSVSSSSGKGLQLGQGFYDAVAGSVVKPGAKGNTLDSASKTAKAQAQNQRNEAANRQMEAQRAQQIANQNPYAEAGKIASVQNDAENRQTINNTSFAAGTAAARLRKTNAPDVQSQMAREDQQANVANQRREEADAAQQGATESEGQAETFAIKSREYNDDKAESANLSMGTPEQSETEEEKTEETPAEEPKEEEPVQEEEPEPEPVQEEEPPQPEPEPEAEKEPEQTPESSGTTWQNVMNYLTYGNDTTSGWNKGTKPGYQEAKAYAESQGWSPIQASQAEFDGDLGHLQELVKAQQPDFYEAWQGGSGRVGANGEQINRGDKGDEVIDSATTPSDIRLKNVMSCLSDLRLKSIRNAYDRDGCCSPEDFLWLAAHTGGKFNHNDREYDFFNDDDWADDNDGSVLSGYADYIKNYVYTYKPEATQIDSRIDPNEQHIGPMAQDIEMVNPACIKETPEGVKTVDTARLAMMNAGAIGDLARQMQDLVDKLKAIGVE